MNSKPQERCDPEKLEALLRGTLSNEEMTAMEAHLSHCRSCAEQIQLAAVPDTSWGETQAMLSLDEYDGLSSLAATSSLVPSDVTNQEDSPTKELLTREISGWLDPTDDPSMLGRFAGYEIVGIIGHGGMGIVLKGFEASLNRYVAIKVLAPRLATNGSARRRFAREAQAAAAVRHDSVIAIHRVGQWHRLPFLTMPYVGGVSLQKRIDIEGPLSIEETLRVGVQIASGLAAAHSQGLVHRDIKPANILLEHGVERVTITDFGLARAADDASVTRTGVVAGTPQYMSPEQAQAKPIDDRSDLFSLGSVLYVMATGRAPFREKGSLDVLNRIIHEPARRMREIEPTIPDWLEAIVMKLLSKSRDDRFDSAEHVAELLAKCLSHLTDPVTNPLPRISLRPSWQKRFTMNDKSVKRSKAPSVIFWTIGFAVFIASVVLAIGRTETVANWYWDSLGALYGVLLYLSGLAGLYVACRHFWNSSGIAEIAITIPIALLPAFIGLIGSVHGYISVHHSISNLGASINETEMSSVHVTVLASLLVGLCFSIVPSIIIASAVLLRRNTQRTVAQPIHHDEYRGTPATGPAPDG